MVHHLQGAKAVSSSVAFFCRLIGSILHSRRVHHKQSLDCADALTLMQYRITSLWRTMRCMMAWA